MLQNYFITALRIMLRQKGYTSINIIGLSMGIAASMIIIFYVVDELGFDRFHQRPDLMYRIGFSGRMQGNEINVATSASPVALALKQEVAEVEEAVRFALWRTMPMSFGENNFTEKHFLIADSNFFSFFNFPLITGDAKTALKGPNKIAITESAAKKYFGEENPIGKVMVRGAEKTASEVTAVIKDPPSNSHIRFDVVLSGESWQYMNSDQWTSNNLYTYVRLHPDADVQKVKDHLNALVEKNMGSELEKFLGLTFEQFREQGNNVGLFLQPMLNIHLRSNLSDEIIPNNNIQYLYIFSAIAVFIILIACINFMNLSTARSANRAKEVGVRKAIGALRKRLILQFMSESFLYSLLSTIMAIILIALALEPFNMLSGKSISLSILYTPWVITTLVLLVIIVGILAGSYPALYLTSFKPTEVLKGKIRAGFKNSMLRNFLVIVQFIISIALIFGSLVVYHQLKYMQEKNLGFDKENVVNLLHTLSLKQNATAFKNDINSHPEFKGASFANRLPPRIDWMNAFRKGGSEQDFLLTNYQVDYDHLTTMGYTLSQGRFFSRDFPSDSMAIILNETAYRSMGFENLEEAEIISYNYEEPTMLKVIGVIKDFNYESLRSVVKPMAITLGREPNYEMAIRLSAGDTQKNLALLESIWKKHAPEAAFEYSFIDKNFDALFHAERRLSDIILIFTVLAIGIACLGLFGLAAYTAEQRAKEISIRKVMGASLFQVVILLVKDFTILVSVSFVIAAPLAYFVAQGWLLEFANRIVIAPWMVIVSGLISFLIALFTISYQAFSAAQENPVHAMRGE